MTPTARTGEPMPAEKDRREELLRTLPERDLLAIEPLSSRHFESALREAEQQRRAVVRADQPSRLAPNLRFR